jgi:hypothetical protein
LVILIDPLAGSRVIHVFFEFFKIQIQLAFQNMGIRDEILSK